MPEILTKKIDSKNLRAHVDNFFGDMVKFVVDIEKGVLAVGAEMHADCEALLLQAGSKPENVWGANLYPDNAPQARIEYLSLINIRPKSNNHDMYIQDKEIRERVKTLVDTLLLSPHEQMA